jgi:hypothetical protein
MTRKLAELTADNTMLKITVNKMVERLDEVRRAAWRSLAGRFTRTRTLSPYACTHHRQPTTRAQIEGDADTKAPKQARSRSQGPSACRGARATRIPARRPDADPRAAPPQRFARRPPPPPPPRCAGRTRAARCE